jgi:hypothetical protein
MNMSSEYLPFKVINALQKPVAKTMRRADLEELLVFLRRLKGMGMTVEDISDMTWISTACLLRYFADAGEEPPPRARRRVRL